MISTLLHLNSSVKTTVLVSLYSRATKLVNPTTNQLMK